MREQLKQVRELIDLNGLAHAAYRDRDGCYCIMGAVHTVCGSRDGAHGTMTPEGRFQARALERHLASLIDGDTGGFHRIASFNDRSTKQEVLNFLDKAIECAPSS